MIKEFLTKKNVLALLGLLLLAVALPVATILVKQSQETRKEAVACPATSYFAFTNTAGQNISSAQVNDVVQTHVYLTGNIHAADIVLRYKPALLELTSAGVGTSYPNPDADGWARWLLTIKKAPGASYAVSGEVAVVTFKVVAPAGTLATAQIVYGSNTTIAYNGVAGGATCGTNGTLALNGGPTNTPVPTATATLVPTNTPIPTLTLAPTPTLAAQERCRLTVVGGTNHALGETVRIQLLQLPKFLEDGNCYNASQIVNVSPGGQTINVSGFSRDARTQEFTWPTAGKSVGTYTFSSFYGGHNDNGNNAIPTGSQCNPNLACCDNSYTCSTQVVLTAAATPTVPACPKLTLPDATADSQVAMADFQRWKDEFTGVLTTKTADFNCDNNITMADFQIWKDYFVSH